MPKISVDLSNVDWKLLRKQKLTLHTMIGIVCPIRRSMPATCPAFCTSWTAFRIRLQRSLEKKQCLARSLHQLKGAKDDELNTTAACPCPGRAQILPR